MLCGCGDDGDDDEEALAENGAIVARDTRRREWLGLVQKIKRNPLTSAIAFDISDSLCHVGGFVC